MAMDRDTLERHLREEFPNAEIEIIDLAGDNNHWKAVVCLLYTSPSPRD